jgi:hypothetical protein
MPIAHVATRRRAAVRQSPVGETDSGSVIFTDCRSVFQLERLVIVAKNDGDDVGEYSTRDDGWIIDIS